MTQVYKNLDLRTVTDPKQTEVTALFAGVSILLLIIGGSFRCCGSDGWS